MCRQNLMSPQNSWRWLSKNIPCQQKFNESAKWADLAKILCQQKNLLNPQNVWWWINNRWWVSKNLLPQKKSGDSAKCVVSAKCCWVSKNVWWCCNKRCWVSKNCKNSLNKRWVSKIWWVIADTQLTSTTDYDCTWSPPDDIRYFRRLKLTIMMWRHVSIFSYFRSERI